MLLKQYPQEPKFSNGKFWSPATGRNGIAIAHGFKMKWRQVGNGRVQLRLPVMMRNEVYLCEAYVKKNGKIDKRMMAKFQAHIQLIQRGQYSQCGVL